MSFGGLIYGCAQWDSDALRIGVCDNHGALLVKAWKYDTKSWVDETGGFWPSDTGIEFNEIRGLQDFYNSKTPPMFADPEQPRELN